MWKVHCYIVFHKTVALSSSAYDIFSGDKIPRMVVMTLVNSFFWQIVFDFLEPDDLVVVAGVCYSWWKFVFQGNRVVKRKLSRCGKFDLQKSGKLYQKIPLWIFAHIYSLNISSTTISSDNFIVLTKVSSQLKALQIDECGYITEDAIFRTKCALPELRSVNISYNPQFGILAIACLCSYESIHNICFNGIKLKPEELLFLANTFPRVANGGIDLRSNEIEGGDYFWNVFEDGSDVLF